VEAGKERDAARELWGVLGVMATNSVGKEKGVEVELAYGGCSRLKHVTTFDPQAYGPTPFSPRGDP
jgi:hypothetical protein